MALKERVVSSLLSVVPSVMLGVSCFALAACAAFAATEKVPAEIWKSLADGKAQDLIVAFDDSEITAQASQLNKSKQIMFDDADTMRFKAERYAAMKRSALSAMPAGEFAVLEDYDSLPLIFLRFRTAGALNALLAQRAARRAYVDENKHITPERPKP